MFRCAPAARRSRPYVSACSRPCPYFQTQGGRAPAQCTAHPARRAAAADAAGRARPGAEGEEAPSRGLFALPFMQRALEKRKAAAQAQAEALLQVRRPRLYLVPSLPRSRWRRILLTRLPVCAALGVLVSASCAACVLRTGRACVLSCGPAHDRVRY